MRALALLLLAPAVAAADATLPVAPTIPALPLAAVVACPAPGPASEPQESRLALMRQLLDSTPERAPEKPDLRHRLAQAYADAAAYYARRGDGERQRVWAQAAVKELRGVVDEPSYASYRRRDEALAELSALLLGLERADQAVPMVRRLLTDHPRSPYVPEVFVQLGDTYFARRAYDDALRFYAKARQFPNGRCYVYASYKEGLARAAVGDQKGALERFAGVLLDRGHPADTALASQVREATVSAYAQVGRAAVARPFFERVGGAEAQGMLSTLAARYEASGRATDAALVRRALGR